MSIRPLHDIIVVNKEPEPKISKGGIHLITSHRPCIGEVVSIGPGTRDSSGELIEHGIGPGDRVVWFTEDKEEPMSVQGEEVLTVRVSHLMAVISEDGTIRPLHNVLIVDKEEDQHQSKGGIFLPNGDDAPSMGTVVAVGPGVIDEHGDQHPVGVKAGDRIAWLYSHQKTFDIDGEDVIMVIGNGILGIL